MKTKYTLMHLGEKGKVENIRWSPDKPTLVEFECGNCTGNSIWVDTDKYNIHFLFPLCFSDRHIQMWNNLKLEAKTEDEKLLVEYLDSMESFLSEHANQVYALMAITEK